MNWKEACIIFGLAHLRPGQREVIESVLSGCDTLAVMPTGGGQVIVLSIAGTQPAGDSDCRFAPDFIDERSG